MRKHEQKRCPRCQALFECKSGSILLCQCQTVYLEPEHLEYVSERYTDCLCAACLKVVRAEYDSAQITNQLKIHSTNKWCWASMFSIRRTDLLNIARDRKREASPPFL